MHETTNSVVMTLNQQQRELLDRTVARGIAPDRESLIRLALREYAAWRDADTAETGAGPTDTVAS